MQEKKKRKINNQSGAAMLISVVFFLFISLAIISGLVGPTVREFKNASVNLNSKKSYFLAESGSEDVTYRMIKNMTVGNSETLGLGDSSAVTTVTTLTGGSKKISALGDVYNYKRKTDVILSTGVGLSFNYGMQIGNGGLNMENSASINGSVYANGNITGSNSAKITGTAFAADDSVISGMIIGQSGAGNAYAHTVNNSTIAGNLYCQTGSGNNKSCDTSQEDPETLDFPVSDSQIQLWKDEAFTGGTQTGNINLSGDDILTVGPKKIVGNITLSNNAILIVSGTLWVTGNISLSNNAQIKLSSSYGSASGVVVSGGTISTANSALFKGSGSTGSYIMMLTTSTSSSAINISNSAGTVIMVAPYGTISFSNSASVKEAIAKTINMSNTSSLIYDSGLINQNFIGGPSGSWKVDSWIETE